MLIAQMPIAIISAIVAAPVLMVSACISKIYSCITGNKPMDVSRETFIDEMTDYVSASKGLTSTWTCDGKVHVLCRYATVFSGYPPIVLIHGTGSCSLNYAEFMQSLPRVYDVYCIDLPGWGISEDPYFDLADNSLRQCCEYYGDIIMSALYEIYPVKNAKFMFVGHSFGAFLLVKIIASGYIPRSKIESCTLVCPSGLDTTTKYQIMGALFSFGFQESIFKQWWSQHLFSAFLYRKKTQLQTLQTLYRFIQNGDGYKLVKKQIEFRYFWWFRVEWVNLIQSQLIYIANNISVKVVCGLHDQLIDCVRTKNVSDESSEIKYHALKGGHSLFSQKELFSRLLTIIDDNVK